MRRLLGANGYIKIINRWLRFKGIEEMKYFKEYGSEFTIQYCSQEEVRKLMQVAKAKGLREYAMFSSFLVARKPLSPSGLFLSQG